YLAGSPSAMCPADREPIHLLAIDVDPLELAERSNTAHYRPPRLTTETCITCHIGSGVLTMNSYTRFFSARLANNAKLDDLGPSREVDLTKYWKEQDQSWGMLRGYWEAGGDKGNKR